MSPLYEYRCECGNEFEELVSYAEKDTITCPLCKCQAQRKPSTYYIQMFPIKSVKVNGRDVV